MEEQLKIKEICPTTTQSWVADGALLVDVREKDELEQLAIDVPHIFNIPLSQFEERYSEIPKNQKVVMVCKSGGRSLRATSFLINHEYEQVVNMQYGIKRWAEKGFPTKGDVNSVLGNSDSSCCDSSSCC